MLVTLWMVACGIHDPNRVAEIAREAETDPRMVERLVKALKSDDPETWQEAYASLIELGPIAHEPLKRAVRNDHPAAGRAILALAEMCDPTLYPFLESRRDDPRQARYVEEAFRIGERPLYERMMEERQIALCDAYLRWYPHGSWRDRATLLRHELLAEEAWSELGRKPRDAEIIAFLRRYGDTPTARRARDELTRRLLVDASKELGRGRLEEALARVREAREVDPEVNADAMEASVRFALGKQASERGRLGEAVDQLEEALALGGSADSINAILGGVYLERSRGLFQQGKYVEAMQALRRAEQAEPSLAAVAGETRGQQVYDLMLRLDTDGQPEPGVVEALVLAGPAAQVPLEAAFWGGLATGDSAVLKRAIDAAADILGDQDAESRRWVVNVVVRALSEADGNVKLLLSDSVAMTRLFRGGDFQSPEYLRSVREAQKTARRYIAVVAAAHYHEARIGPVKGPLPGAPPLAENSVAELFRQGHDGREALGLPLLTRVQLLSYQLERIQKLGEVASDGIPLLAGEILERGLAPYTLPDWVRLLHEVDTISGAGPTRVRLTDGTSVRVVGRQDRQDYNVTISTSSASNPLPDAWIGQALAVLFGLSRPLLAAHPAVERYQVIWECPRDPDSQTTEERLRLSVTRHTVGELDWTLLEGEPEYGPRHLSLVPHNIQ